MQFGMIDYGYGMDFRVWILLIIFWILGIAGLVLIVKHLWECRAAKREEDSALGILKKRYVRGEIGKEEFEEMKKELV